MAAKQDAREFLDAILVYPVNFEFSLWNLQGDMGIRLSCKRRQKAPAELEFEHEIALAKELGWLEERPEDLGFTQEYQELGLESIRSGRMFVRLAKSSVIRQQIKRFVDLYGKKVDDLIVSGCIPPDDVTKA